ncbi:hypothetical protein FQR65_LT17461 [Abscondita terminalis]|nr:hypothetical protein FQR65_LT17461 [Abscondita terminalis]
MILVLNALGYAVPSTYGNTNRVKVVTVVANVTSPIDKATPLFIAAQNGHYKILVYLLAQGAEPDSRRTDGATPLWIAAQMGHDHIVSQLLKSGARVDAARHDGATALFKAAHKGHSAVVGELLRYKPSLGLLPNGESALHAAALFGHLSVCKQLIAAGADPALNNQDNLTSSKLAADHKHNIINMDTPPCMMAGSKLQSEAALKEGWIKKKDEFTKIWNSRYFVLERNGSLLEFNNKNDHDNSTRPKAQHNLKNCEICILEDFDSNGIIITCQNASDNITLSAISEDERNEWISVLDSFSEDSLFGFDCDNKPSISRTRKINIDDFKFIKTLGKGAYGKVLLCEEINTNEIYAIKILKKEIIIQQREVDHILTENNVLKSTNHPFLTSLKYSFQTNDNICFVMEYVNGGDLFFHLNKEGSFNEERTKFYAAETLLALSYLHTLGIVYRDLKTENMVLDKNGHIKLVDFGLCKEGVGYGKRTYTFCGTPEYMAPEVITDVEYGQAVDWWGLGIVMYEMICAQLPFYNKNYEILITLITIKPVEFPGFISTTAKDLISDLLIKNPLKRLGAGPTDAEEIKTHAFFKDLDWAAVEQRKIQPPFVPQLRNATDTKYFDQDFTSQPVYLSKSTSSDALTTDDYFGNFSFKI